MRSFSQLCSAEGCLRPNKAKGLCNKHWNEKKRRQLGIPPRNWRERKRDIPCSVEGCTRVSQPSGQRVSDKVSWALEFLRLYAPEKLVP